MNERKPAPLVTDGPDAPGAEGSEAGQGFALSAQVQLRAADSRPEPPAPAAAARGERVEPDAPHPAASATIAPSAWFAPEAMAVPLPSDDRFADQFYLLNTAAGERDLHLFASPTGTAVWEDYTGAGVRIGIIDDGIDFNHPDLDDNYDFSREPVSGFHPDAGDAHGTAVAGIIAAENNGTGVVGIAHDAQITMMAGIGGAPNISIAAAFQNAVNFDVLNNSWGYTAPWFDQPFNAVLAADYTAFDAISLNGRGGLGTVFVKSAGNGRTTNTDADNANFSGLNSSAFSVTVAAVDRDGFVSEYSTEGACLLVSAFGTPLAGQVVTTDRLGAAGYDPGDTTSTFNGTSAAAPMVSGVVALMLQANPLLGYRDVSEILAMTARHTGSAIGSGPAGNEAYAWEWNASTRWNGQGLHFSEDYGFGLVDALAAVRLAESWTQTSTRANLVTRAAITSSLGAPVAIPDNNAIGVTVTFTMAAGLSIEQMRLDLGLSHTFTADLRITLTSPSGTVSQLLDHNGGGLDIPDNGIFDITLASHMFRGEDTGGIWTLRIADVVAGDSGTLSQAALSAIGRTSTDDIYVMTEEASQYTIPSTITDSNGGNDTLNASAVFSASRIALDGSASSIDGRSITLANIENAIGGDGNDSLFGGTGANGLSGFRGNDLLSGAAGNDTLSGGRGDDSLSGGAGNDLLDGGAGTDAAYFDGAVDVDLAAGTTTSLTQGNDTLIGIEAITGSAGNDTLDAAAGVFAPLQLFGNAGADAIWGGEADDLLRGGDGDDDLQGRAGDDLVFGDAGFDFAHYLGAVTVSLALGTAAGADDGNDQLSGIEGIGGSEEADLLSAAGVAFAVNLYGNGGDDDLAGGAAADLLVGGGGTDLLAGGAGNDTLQGGADFDYAAFGSAVAVALAGGTATGEGDDQLGGIEGVVGSAFADLLDARGVATEVHLLGGDGADTLFAGDGSDLLEGGAGNDTLTASFDDTVLGGAGDDLIVNPFFNGGDFDGGAGNDTLDLSLDPDGDTATYDLSAPSFTTNYGGIYAGFENLIGTILGETILGTSGANLLDGHLGDDTLDGGAGDDTLVGGDGNDTYLVDAGDLLDESGTVGSAADVVRSGVSWSLAGAGQAGIEQLVLTGTAAIDGTGNALANRVTGNAAANRLDGGAGNDTLTGGLGIDSLIGGDGDDTYLVGTGDRIDETGTAGSNADSVQANLTWSLAAVGNTAIERLTLTGSAAIHGTGNGLANGITGNSAANRLDGAAGNDTLAGGAGNDTLIGGLGIDSLIGGDGSDTYVVGAGDRVSEASTTGSSADLVQADVAWSLAATGNTAIERLTLSGTAAIHGTGNGLANGITGNSAANRLDGAAGNDTLAGGAGNDTLIGGLGTDSLIGGDGSDLYLVGAGDRVNETGTAASTADLVQADGTWSLAATGNTTIERLTLIGSGTIDGTGNTLANVITGNSSHNRLSGGAGNDSLAGGLGNDTLAGGTGKDTLVGGGGLDVFRFDTALSAATNVDAVSGFIAADDLFQLENAAFVGVGAAGALAAGAFRAGAAAGDAGDRVIYNAATGQLFFDADGTGAMAKVLFATVGAGTVVTAGDFFIT